jgi:thymidylate synthase (FAD)
LIVNNINVEYVDHMGTDLSVVNAARVSFKKISKEFKNSDEGLIRYLARGFTTAEYDEIIDLLKEGTDDPEELYKKIRNQSTHFTPFTHTAITIRETVPIFVARQRFKSTIGFTYNEVSRRYVEDDPDFYLPDNWRKKAANKKQGSLENDFVTELSGGYNINSTVDDFYIQAYKLYTGLLIAGVCAEQARMVLPQSMMTTYVVTGNIMSFARLYNLRNKPDAQKEIRDLAYQVCDIIQPLYPISWKYLTE